jgi:hypothetical protein
VSGAALDRLGVAAICCSAALAALFELLLVPLYAGSVLVPLAVPLAVVSNVALPRLAYILLPRIGAALLPFLSWLLVIGVVGLMPRAEGDVILPGEPNSVVLTSYGVLLAGAVAGTVTVALSVARRPRMDREQDGAPAGGPQLSR